MSSRPVVFISAVSRELRSTRDLVAKTLISLGYEPKWQDIAPTETGDLKAVLRKWVDGSHAVLQIVGHRYGFAPAEPDPEFGPVSYTQYESLYARKKGMPVWYIILDASYPVDCNPDESRELLELQANYRIQVKSHQGLYHLSLTPLSTENIVLRLRDDLSSLRRSSRRWNAAILFLGMLAIGGITWLIRSQDGMGDDVHQSVRKMETVIGGNSDLAAQVALIKAGVDEVARQRDPSAAPLTQDALEQALANNLGWSRERLSKTLAEGRMSENLLIKGQSLLVGGESGQAEENFDKVIATEGEAARRLRFAFEGKATIATARGDFNAALAHLETAASLTRKETEPLAWAASQNKIVYLLILLGEKERAEPLARDTLSFCDKQPPQDNAEALVALNNLAQVLQNLGNFREALPMMERALEISESSYGKYDPRIATTLNNLAQLHVVSGRLESAQPLIERSILVLLKYVRNAPPGHDHSNLAAALSNYNSLMRRQGSEKEAVMEKLLAIGIDAGWDKDRLVQKLGEYPELLDEADETKETPVGRRSITQCPTCYAKVEIIEKPGHIMLFRCFTCGNNFYY